VRDDGVKLMAGSLYFRYDSPRPPTGRAPSGTLIKTRITRAMADQYAAFMEAHEAVDRLMRTVRAADSLPPPNPSAKKRVNGQSRE
jgi:hypothetical protein